ncbi:MAG: ornithine cyclodeaminase [Alphaproteobacteria bacterium]|nr:ornithine cyclodeaminase [Alphaproteobacteria bacterium]
MKFISTEDLTSLPDWLGVIAALEQGHRLPQPQIADIFLGDEAMTMLSRAAYVDGLGSGVKTVTVIPDNQERGLPTVQGAMLCFETGTGTPLALVDSELVTRWKTAADSVLGARCLARSEPKILTIFGAGAVSDSLAEAYAAQFPTLEQVRICGRSSARAGALVDGLLQRGIPAVQVRDAKVACEGANIVSTATTSKVPVLEGDWVGPGTHVDLIGAFKADMREADDALMERGRIFVDSRETTLDHIGELMIPIQSGVIARNDVQGDLYDLVGGDAGRVSPEEITVFKNGGGAHLDLMIAHYLIQLAQDPT